MPEYIPLLRGEAERALRESGGAWTLETLNNLHRLDSFLKESQRLNSLSFRKCKIENHFPATGDVLTLDIFSRIQPQSDV